MRLAEHQVGGKCAYTSVRRPVELAWSEQFGTRCEAKEAETRIKRWSRAKKQALINGDYQALRLAAKKKDWGAYEGRKKAVVPPAGRE